jgi:hypothetical protein
MNDKITTAFLAILAGAMVVGILYIAFAPISELAGRNSRHAAEEERLEATIGCIKQSGASMDRDFRVAAYKASKCAEQSR